MIDIKRLGSNVIKARENLNMKQIELSKSLGSTNGVISHIENGKRGPSLQYAVRMCKILQITLDELVKGAIV